jgi:hypothetical protein
MAEKIALDRQVNAGQTALYQALSDGVVEDREAVEQLCKTLEWMKENEATLKIAIELKDDRALKAALEEFPDAEVSLAE